jgi:hypothetical protein
MTAPVSATANAALPRKEAYSDMNDWLNALVVARVERSAGKPEAQSAELAYVAETRHVVYQRRSQVLVFAFLGLIAAGFAASPSVLALLVTFVALYFYVDFYSGVLHVVLDNPRFVRLPLIGVPCVEFQWHHALPYDISTRRLVHVWGDLNVLLLSKAAFLFLLAGFSRTTAMVAGVGFFWAYANQFAHRSAHAAAKKRAPWVQKLQSLQVLVPPAVHHEHHTTHDRSFPVLSGRSRNLIQWLLGVVPNQWAWLWGFLLLTALDLVGFSYLLAALVPHLPF